MYQTKLAPTTSLFVPKRKILLAAIAAGAAVLSLLPLSLLSFVLLAVGAASFALLWRDTPSPLYLLCLPAAYGGGLLVVWFSDFLAPLSALAPLLAGWALGICLRRGIGRTAQILWATLGLVLPTAFLLAFDFFAANGIPNVTEFRALIDGWRTDWVAAVTVVTEEMFGTLTPEAAQLYRETFTAETIEALVSFAMVVTPVAVLDLYFVLAYLSTTFYVQAVRICRVERYLPDAPYLHTMSVVSAILYVAAFLSFCFLAFSDVVYAVSLNVLLLLLPGFAMLSLKRLLWRRKHGLLGRAGQTYFFLFLFLLIFFLPFAFLLLGLGGAYEILERAIRDRTTKGGAGEQR